MTITGTSYFPNAAHALAYYKKHLPGASKQEIAQYVEAKVKSGEITIGKPPQKPGEKLFIQDHRWHIESKD